MNTPNRTFALIALVGGHSAGAAGARRRAKTGDHMNVRLSARQATVVTPEQAMPLKIFGMDANLLLTTEATGGAVSVVLGHLAAGDGPPDHVHLEQDEMFYVLEGTVELTAAEQTAIAGPGSIVFVPRTVVQRFRNAGTSTVRMLECSLPGGLDRYFKAISDLAARDGFTREQAMEVGKQFGTGFPAAHHASRGKADRRDVMPPAD
jgi:quercetin dioxygenase-like cupin family protein